MTLEGRGELREARQRFLKTTDDISDRLATIGRRLGYLSLILAFGLTLLAGGIAWRIAPGCPAMVRPQAPMVVTVVQGQAIPIHGWKSTETCFTTTLVFASGLTTCEDPGKNRTCDWGSFHAAGQSIESFLREVRPGAFGIVRVFGGHDSKPVRSGGELDSNFDLAHRRAVLVADAVKTKLPSAGQHSWLIIPEVGSYPPPCGEPPPQRRQPVLNVTIWEPDHD